MTSFGEQDAYLFREGTHTRLHDRLGAHLGEHNATAGCFFSVWAPGAAEVGVMGDFNGWEADAAPMELDETSGIWTRFEPGVRDGSLYKYHVHSRLHDHRVDKSDPFAFYREVPPETASIVWPLDYDWNDAEWMDGRVDAESLRRARASRSDGFFAPLQRFELSRSSRHPDDCGRIHRVAARLAPDLCRRARLFPLALDYARFRAATEAHGANWTQWPDKLRDGLIEEAEVEVEPNIDDDAVRYHLYSQMLAEEQIAEIAAGNAELYFDLPLGVRRFSYDAWREQTLFAHDVDVGAPPDAAFPGGQNWSFPPVLPEKSRLQNHRHLRLVYRHAMRHADILRIDHVMGLHRQFWIPRGASVADGVYIRYPAEELYATLNIESHRARCELVGENLGLVPDVVTKSLAQHGFRGLYIAELTPDAPIPTGSVASLNTHDTELFVTSGADLETALQKLLKSEADLVSVTLEDLWNETSRQNVPGTKDEHPNWQRPLRHTLEDIKAQLGATLDRFTRD